MAAHIKKEMDQLLADKKSSNSAVSFLRDLYRQRYHKENVEAATKTEAELQTGHCFHLTEEQITQFKLPAIMCSPSYVVAG